MGKPIVYCVACGRSLREDDFLKRRAQMADNRPWCADCRPVSDDAPPVPRARKSSSKIPVPVPPTTPRRAMAARPPPSRAPVWTALAAVAVVLVVIVAVLSRPAPAPPAPAPAAADERTERAVVELERFAASATPASVLARCAALRDVVRGTPLERRVQAVEDAALRRQAAATTPVPAVDAAERHLAQIRDLIAADRTYRRREEVLNMIAAAKRSAGPRAGDFDRLQAEYDRRYEEDRRRAADEGRGEIDRAAAAPALALLPREARLSGTRIFTSGTGDEHAIEGIALDSRIGWTVTIPRPGRYRVDFHSACPEGNGGRFRLRLGAAALEGATRITGGWKTYQTWTVGSVDLAAGAIDVELEPLSESGGLMNLRSIRLSPE